VLESLLASARAVRIDGGAVGIGVAMGSLPDGRVLFLAPESLSKPCARARCVVGARDGGAGAPLEAKSHLFPEASFGFSIWALPDGDAVGATPFESEERLRRFEPVLLATIDGPLPGFVARGTGSLHSNVELDFGRRVAQGPVFSATTGRLVGFTRAVGESGEIRQLSRVTWVWDLLLGRKE
jgi:hypothetical protein